jgi:hypothetical protein
VARAVGDPTVRRPDRATVAPATADEPSQDAATLPAVSHAARLVPRAVPPVSAHLARRVGATASRTRRGVGEQQASAGGLGGGPRVRHAPIRPMKHANAVADRTKEVDPTARVRRDRAIGLAATGLPLRRMAPAAGVGLTRNRAERRDRRAERAMTGAVRRRARDGGPVMLVVQHPHRRDPGRALVAVGPIRGPSSRRFRTTRIRVCWTARSAQNCER